MLVPAITYKETIEQEFKKIQYSEKYLWYTGSIDNYDIEVKTEGDKFSFAIVDKSDELYGDIVIGYISFRVDWYCSMAYNFSLIKFDITQNSPCSTLIMADAIREVIRMIESFNLHKIDFRCVEGNPAEFNGIIRLSQGSCLPFFSAPVSGCHQANGDVPTSSEATLDLTFPSACSMMLIVFFSSLIASSIFCSLWNRFL